MTLSRSVLAVAKDPGGAAAVAPVLTALVRKGDVEVTLLAHGQGCRVFTRAGLRLTECDHLGRNFESDKLNFATSVLHQHNPKVVLTATSLDSGLEKGFIRATRIQDIPCVTVLDSWTNYRARFLQWGEEHVREEVLPDIITVMDDFAAEEMRGEGFPGIRLEPVGQPAFDHLVKWSKSDSVTDDRCRIRRELGIETDITLIAFFSQPISEMYGLANSATSRGYDEFRVLGLLVSALRRTNLSFVLVVKTHPKEKVDKFNELLSETTVRVVVLDEHDDDALILAADIIVGMTSIALVKGLLAGRRVLSLQPDRRGKDALILGRMGILKPITDPRQLPVALSQVISEPNSQHVYLALPSLWTDGLATDRVVGLLDMFLANS